MHRSWNKSCCKLVVSLLCQFGIQRMGGTICDYRVVQQVQTWVCHHKDKHFALHDHVVLTQGKLNDSFVLF